MWSQGGSTERGLQSEAVGHAPSPADHSAGRLLASLDRELAAGEREFSRTLGGREGGRKGGKGVRREDRGGREQAGRGREGGGGEGRGRGGEGRERERTSREAWRLGVKEGKRREEDDEETRYVYLSYTGNFLTQIFPCDKLCSIIFIPTSKHVLRVTCPCCCVCVCFVIPFFALFLCFFCLVLFLIS